MLHFCRVSTLTPHCDYNPAVFLNLHCVAWNQNRSVNDPNIHVVLVCGTGSVGQRALFSELAQMPPILPPDTGTGLLPRCTHSVHDASCVLLLFVTHHLLAVPAVPLGIPGTFRLGIDVVRKRVVIDEHLVTMRLVRGSCCCVM